MEGMVIWRLQGSGFRTYGFRGSDFSASGLSDLFFKHCIGGKHALV